MSTCIIILGLPRSGTSAVAGTIHQMGVNMGEGNFQPPDKLNPKGYYEDLRWQHWNKSILGSKYGSMKVHEKIGSEKLDRLRQLVIQCSTNPIWGFKDPRTCFTLHLMAPIFEELGVGIKLIKVGRSFDSVLESIKNHSRVAYNGLSNEKAIELVRNWSNARHYQIMKFTGAETATLEYSRFLRNQLSYAGFLAYFCYKGTGLKAENESILKSVDWLDQGLNHYD